MIFLIFLHLQTYDIQGNLQHDSQVTVSVIFENKSTSFLKSMELNVLDSLNTKMLRPEGSSVHDGIPVPFQLPPGTPSLAQSGPALPSCGKSRLDLWPFAVFGRTCPSARHSRSHHSLPRMSLAAVLPRRSKACARGWERAAEPLAP